MQGKVIIADRGYSTFAGKNFIESCEADCCIPPKSNFKHSWDYDREKYKSRNKVERFFGHLKEKRRIATRFDKLASRFLSLRFSLGFSYSTLSRILSLKEIIVLVSIVYTKPYNEGNKHMMIKTVSRIRIILVIFFRNSHL